MSDQVFWYATRAAGLMCWFSACASVGVGVLMSSRALGPRPTVPWLTDLHRYLSAMAMVFLWLHMVSLGLDSFVDFGWRELFLPGVAEVPGMSRIGLALGVVSAWLMAVVQLTSLIRRHLPSRLWHRIHLTSYATVLLTTVHAWMSGSDAANHVLIGLAVSTLTALALLTGIRLYWVLLERKARYELALRQERPSGAGASGARPSGPSVDRRAGPGPAPAPSRGGPALADDQEPERLRWPKPAGRAERADARSQRAAARVERAMTRVDERAAEPWE